MLGIPGILRHPAIFDKSIPFPYSKYSLSDRFRTVTDSAIRESKLWVSSSRCFSASASSSWSLVIWLFKVWILTSTESRFFSICSPFSTTTLAWADFSVKVWIWDWIAFLLSTALRNCPQCHMYLFFEGLHPGSLCRSLAPLLGPLRF